MQQHRYLLFLPTLLFLLTMLVLEIGVYQATGRIVYPIDDPYIHMAMARHLAQDGIYGVSLAGYSASSSAPGWTLMLSSSFLVLGDREWIPLAWNLFAGILLIAWMTFWLQRYIANRWAVLLWSLFYLFALPLPAIVALGMEHTLHILLIVALVARSMKILLREDRIEIDLPLLILAMLATAFRYETLFVIGPIILLFIAKDQWRDGFLIALGSAAAIVIPGMINLLYEWSFWPNPILNKSALGAPSYQILFESTRRLFGQLFCTAHLVVPFMLCTIAIIRSMWDESAFSSEAGILSFITVTAMILHCAFASIGWFYRYEAYLITLAAMALPPWTHQIWPYLHSAWMYNGIRHERLLSRFCVLMFILLLPVIFYVNLRSLPKIIPGAHNLYSQQYQMGLFLKEYYSGQTVLANDIGAINYLADIHCLDMMGLASMEPLQANRLDRWGSNFIDTWGREREAKIAILYESWFPGLIPEAWVKMGEWTVDRKVTVADTTVTFYAVSPVYAETIHRQLQEYKNRLPQGVSARLAERLRSE